MKSWSVIVMCVVGLFLTPLTVQYATAAPLTVDDVLNTVSIDMVAPSPDGKDVAVVIQRPVSDQEIAGRASYEVDPSRNDVWLMARDESARRNLTQGKRDAAGFWCAQWSPDSRYLAMLSTKPKRREPRGGNAVRLYLWSRNSQRLTRLSEPPMMTQNRYGSPINALDLRGGAGDDRGPKVCLRYNENAPFLWLDARHILAVQMPDGQTSALFSKYGRPAEEIANMAKRLHDGHDPTVDVSDSNRAVLAAEASRYTAEVAVIDVSTGERRLLAKVPDFPFHGMLSLVVSPDGKQLAILAPTTMIPPHLLGSAPAAVDETIVEKRLGLMPLDGSAAPLWIAMPEGARYPLDLLDWSPDDALLALRVRSAASDQVARVFTLDTKTAAIVPATPDLIGSPFDAGTNPHQVAAIWQLNDHLLIRGRRQDAADAPESWWEAAPGQAPQPAAPPDRSATVLGLPGDADILARDRKGVIWQEPTPRGLFLRETPEGAAKPHELIALDTHLAKVDWGEERTIDYTSQSGKALKSLVILPPGYRPEKRYPLLVWVYPGTKILGTHGYWSDLYLPGIYNLQLYAALGYVVLVPSMPLPDAKGPNNIYRAMTDGVLPAIDKAVVLGIADPVHVGLFGQSMGGYAVYALITQTDRFASAVAIAGLPDYTVFHGSFDRGATGWPGIAQDKSSNAMIAEMGNKLHARPFDDPGFYAAVSPITYVGQTHTPLLMAHGTLDERGGIDEAEVFFTELDRQGKPARLLRYEGENHAISLSPANVRNLFGETIAWFDRYVKGSP